MHNAPAVSYPAGRSRFAAMAMLLAWAVAGAGIVSWWLKVHTAPAIAAAAFAILMASGAFASYAWLRSPQGRLSWDGLGWTWAIASRAQTGTAEVALDAQRVMLLRWRGDAGGPRWLWLEQRAMPAHWNDLRRAVYSRAIPP